MRSSSSKYETYNDKDVASTLEEIVIMIVVMAIAAGIRFWKLGEWSFWADEVFSVQDAQNFPHQLTINPVMYMIIHFFTGVFGASEWSARFGPCIIGILSVPLLFWASRKMFGAKVALIACVFLLIHPWHIYWSQNARAYSLAFLLGGLAALVFYLAFERDSIGLTILSVFLMALAIFSYPQSAVLLFALAGYVVLLIFFPVGIPRGLNGRNLLTFFAPFLLSLLVLLSPSVRSYLVAGWGANQWGRSPLYILFTVVYCLGVPISVAAFIGGVHSMVYMKRSGLFLICYAVIPFAVLLLISPFLNVAGYYLFFTMPAYLLLAAFCTSELMESAAKRSKMLASAMMLIIFVALLSQTYLYFTVENGGRPKWREAFQTLKHRIGADDAVVVSMPQIAEHYLKETEGRFSSQQVVQLKDAIQQLGSLEDQWRRNGQSVWFVLNEQSLRVVDADRKFREWVYANCHLIKEFPVYAKVTDRTISVWNLKYVKIDLPDEFEEDFMF